MRLVAIGREWLPQDHSKVLSQRVRGLVAPERTLDPLAWRVHAVLVLAWGIQWSCTLKRSGDSRTSGDFFATHGIFTRLITGELQVQGYGNICTIAVGPCRRHALCTEAVTPQLEPDVAALGQALACSGRLCATGSVRD
jgi:hypothetical protein